MFKMWFCRFADQELCKRCGARVDLNNQAALVAEPIGKSRDGLWFKLKIALTIAAVVAGSAAAYFKLTRYFDKTPLYLAAISNSEKFKEPVTVRVNRKEISPSLQFSSYITPEEKKPGSAGKAADVLEALGLITMSVETSVSTVTGPTQYYGGMFIDGRMVSAPSASQPLKDVKSSRLVIELTEKGRLEAANWKEADEPLSPTNIINQVQGQQVYPWWIIPIGDREILRIEKVTPAPSELNPETLMIDFRWRWRPNKLGESFDVSKGAFYALPTKAQQAVTALKMTSESENFGIAKLYKKYGNWECVEIIFPGELLKN